jgi:hypothetical protein
MLYFRGLPRGCLVDGIPLWRGMATVGMRYPLGNAARYFYYRNGIMRLWIVLFRVASTFMGCGGVAHALPVGNCGMFVLQLFILFRSKGTSNVACLFSRNCFQQNRTLLQFCDRALVQISYTCPTVLFLGAGSGGGGRRKQYRWAPHLEWVGKYPWPHKRNNVDGRIFTKISNFI